MKCSIRQFLILSLLLMLGSCSSINEPYVRPEAVPDGKALVVVYRIPFVGGAFDLKLKANGQSIHSIPSGIYYPHMMDPGLIEFSGSFALRDVKPATLFTKPGQIYFITMCCFNPMQGNFSDLRIVIVSDAKAEQAIKEFNLRRLKDP